MSDKFKRENRYIVLKRKHLADLPMSLQVYLKPALAEAANYMPKLDCVVVESDWPEYEQVWQMIERRMTGAALAEPVPPAGGEPEVLGYKFNFAGWVGTDGPQGWRLQFHTERPAQFLFSDGRVTDFVELVDRTHVTRLQAEVERLKDRLADANAIANLATTNLQEFKEDHQAELATRDLLSVTNVMLDVVPGDGDGHEVYAKSVGDVEDALTKCYEEIERLNETCAGLDRQNDALAAEIGTLQAELTKLADDYCKRVDELTKARELLTKAMGILQWDENGTPGVRCAVEISQFLAHQSAPAAMALSAENQRIVPPEPIRAKPHPLDSLITKDGKP